MLIVAEVNGLEAACDDNDIVKVSFAQVSWLSNPHHEEANQKQAIINIILLLNHEIRGIEDDVAHDYNADETRVDGTLGRDVTLLSLRIDQLKVVLSLAPRLPSRDHKADQCRNPERVHAKK